jgi:hypothetical protein
MYNTASNNFCSKTTGAKLIITKSKLLDFPFSHQHLIGKSQFSPLRTFPTVKLFISLEGEFIQLSNDVWHFI